MGFQQGLSGLNAASKNLDVIGHNIANSNTTGFKSSRAEFAALVASSMGGGGSGQLFGVETATVSQQMAQGSLTTTGNPLDLAINGNGFFKVQLPNGSAAYTRAGNFKLDKTGNMVTNSGANVMGYKVDTATGTASVTPVPLNFPIGAPIAPKATTKVGVTLNLDARAKDAAGAAAVAGPPAVAAVPATPRSTYGTSVNVYDSQGVATPVNLYFQKTATANTWDVYDKLDDPTANPAVVAQKVGSLTFDANGKITGTSNITLSITSAANPNSPTAPAPFSVAVDFSKVTQFGNAFAVSDLQQDGNSAGEMTGVNIDDSGMVIASYSNGITRAEAQVALANFRNTQGLTPVGDNNWIESLNSGVPVLGKPGQGNFGSLRSGALEDSNVDLTAELVNMMTAQRSYQANAQTIKTQDQVISTIVNLR